MNRSDMPYDLSLALGSGAFSPLEIVRGYSVFANGGFLVTPYYINRIDSSEGEVIFEHQPLTVCQGCETDEQLSVDPATQQTAATGSEQTEEEMVDVPQYAPRVISEQNAYIMRSILREVVQRGTAVRAKALGRSDIGGKTGTTNDQKDAWFSGFNDQVVTTTWVGFDDQKPLGSRETGGRAALPMWIGYMQDALQGTPVNLEEQPEDMVTVRIDSDTGERADENTANSRFEIFRLGLEPKEQSTGLAGSDVEMPTNGSQGARLAEEDIAEEIF